MTVINNVPRELLERCLSSMADAVHFRETGQGRPPEQTCLFEIQELRALLATAQPAADGERLVVSSAPDRIFLIIGVECPDGAKFAELGETPWCEDDIHGNGIEYVRAAPPAKAEGVAVQVCKLGRLGAAFDPADTRYAYTYVDQPDNVGAMKLGHAAAINAAKKHGDEIDRGLHLLLQLQAEGFGVFQIAAAPVPPVQVQP